MNSDFYLALWHPYPLLFVKLSTMAPSIVAFRRLNDFFHTNPKTLMRTFLPSFSLSHCVSAALNARVAALELPARAATIVTAAVRRGTHNRERERERERGNRELAHLILCSCTEGVAGECVCNPFFTGEFCSESYCDSSPCQNDAGCATSVGCSCSPNFDGEVYDLGVVVSFLSNSTPLFCVL